jgi:hypothetical protein
MAGHLSNALQNFTSLVRPRIIVSHQDSSRSIAAMDDELTTLIIKELGKHHDRKDIIQRVCERSTLNWKEAEQLISLVEAQHHRTIAGRQTPLLLFLSIGTLLLGLGLVAFNLQILSAFLHQDFLTQALSAQSSYFRIVGLVTGLGMTAGGITGLWKAFGVIFPE